MEQQDRRMYRAELTFIAPSKLVPYEGNTKKHPEEQIKELGYLIEKNGFDQPVVVDEAYVIIKGHGRREAALLIGLPVIPVIVRSDMTEAEKLAARIADNKITSLKYDDTRLAAQVKTLREMGIDMRLTALPAPELKRITAEVKPVREHDPHATVTKTYGVSYTLVFNDLDEQQVWFDFLAHLKQKYPDLPTIAQRMVSFIQEHK